MRYQGTETLQSRINAPRLYFCSKFAALSSIQPLCTPSAIEKGSRFTEPILIREPILIELSEEKRIELASSNFICAVFAPDSGKLLRLVRLWRNEERPLLGSDIAEGNPSGHHPRRVISHIDLVNMQT